MAGLKASTPSRLPTITIPALWDGETYALSMKIVWQQEWVLGSMVIAIWKLLAMFCLESWRMKTAWVTSRGFHQAMSNA